MDSKRAEKLKEKSEKLRKQNNLRRWLPSVLICVAFDSVLVAVKGSIDREDLSYLLFADAAILLLNQARIRRIASGESRRQREQELKETWGQLRSELKAKKQQKQ